MTFNKDCVACESGECLEHGEPINAPDDPGPGVSAGEGPASDELRQELKKFKGKVAKSVRRLNRAIKEARSEHREPETGVEVPPEPQPVPGPKMSDAAKLGLGVMRSCRRK